MSRGADGTLQVIQQADADHYSTLAQFKIPGSTGVLDWSAALNSMCVAVDRVQGQQAQLLIFQPKSKAVALKTVEAIRPRGGEGGRGSRPDSGDAHPADGDARLPAYEPTYVERGVIRIWGDPEVKKVLARWEAEFQALHPDITFADRLAGSASAIGALYTDTADLGIVGREIRPIEIAGYLRVKGYEPFPMEVMTGSFKRPQKSGALGVFLNSSNPIDHLTLEQLDAIFGSERLGGAQANLRTWGDLGLKGVWASRPIKIYMGELDADPAFFFSEEVLLGSRLWNENLVHFSDIFYDHQPPSMGYQQALDALARDPGGIALSAASAHSPRTRLLPIAAAGDAPYVLPTASTVETREYPLARSVWVYSNEAVDVPLDPRVLEFLRYVFSREGQRVVKDDGDYLPLTPEALQVQLDRLH